MSTVSESNPWCAMISAENELGIDSQPFTTASPRAQIALSVFSLTSLSLWRRGLRPPLDSPANTRDAWPRPLSTPLRTRGTRGSAPLSTPPRSRKLRAAHHPEIAPAADAKLLGLLEVGDRRGVGRRVDQVRLHGADRQPHLLLDGIEALVVPLDLRHLGLAQVRLVEINLRRRDPQHLGGVERLAAQLEGGALRVGAAGLPVHQRQPSLLGPKSKVGGDPHRRALELEDLGPVLDRPVIRRRLADRRQQRETEEVAQAGRDVARDRLPYLGLQVDGVLVLEQRRRLGALAVAPGLGRAP